MYLEIDEGFPKHRKTLRLRSLMRDPRAGWYVVELWTWACRSCPDGDLSGISAYEIEEAASYAKCDGKLCQSMIDSGFLDADAEGKPSMLHNWMARTGGAIKSMADTAAAKKLYRLHKDGKCDGQSCIHCKKILGLSKDSPRTVRGQGEDETWTNPHKTRPGQSRPGQSRKRISPRVRS